MEKRERVKAAYEYLKSIGKIVTQKDVAELMNMRNESVSKAFTGNEKYLTNKFIYKFNQSFNNIFSINWLLEGKGDMMNNQGVGDISNSNVSGVNVNGKEIHISSVEAFNTLLKIVETNQRNTEKFQEQIDRLLTLLEKR